MNNTSKVSEMADFGDIEWFDDQGNGWTFRQCEECGGLVIEMWRAVVGTSGDLELRTEPQVCDVPPMMLGQLRKELDSILSRLTPAGEEAEHGN